MRRLDADRGANTATGQALAAPAAAILGGLDPAARISKRGPLVGVETMTMLAKGQVRAVPRNDMLVQRAFVRQVFVAA
jgi:hypothetical protein